MAGFKVKMIFVNVETTGFYSKRGTAEICQIAALEYTGKLIFREYILPTSSEFHPKASEESGFTIGYLSDGERVLLLNGEPVETVSEVEAIERFAYYINEPADSNLIILLGFSSDRHDKPFILNAFERYNIKSPLFIVDVLPFLKEVKKNKSEVFGQELAASRDLKRQTIHRHLFGETPYNNTSTHDAVRDVQQLRDIVTHPHFPFYLFTKYIASTIIDQASNKKVQMSHGESSQPTKNDTEVKHESQSTVDADRKVPNRRKIKRKHPIPENDEVYSVKVKKTRMSVDHCYSNETQPCIQ